MFLRHRLHHLQTPKSNFIPYPVYTLKNHLYNCELSVLSWPSFATILSVFSLVHIQLVAAYRPAESQKFLEITQKHHFYSILFEKRINEKPSPASFSKKGA